MRFSSKVRYPNVFEILAFFKEKGFPYLITDNIEMDMKDGRHTGYCLIFFRFEKDSKTARGLDIVTDYRGRPIEVTNP